ncbi:hypothetical protein GCM10018952_05370 [Streptosporangium vulgare]
MDVLGEGPFVRSGVRERTCARPGVSAFGVRISDVHFDVTLDVGFDVRRGFAVGFTRGRECDVRAVGGGVNRSARHALATRTASHWHGRTRRRPATVGRIRRLMLRRRSLRPVKAAVIGTMQFPDGQWSLRRGTWVPAALSRSTSGSYEVKKHIP